MGTAIITRRRFVQAAGAVSALTLAGRAHAADSLDALAGRAAGEAEAVWYESSRPDQGDQVVAVFSKNYPKVKVRHESIPGGNGVAARLTQEKMAGHATADIVTVGSGETAQILKSSDIVAQLPYADYGVDPRLVFKDRTVNTAVTIYCIVYNTTMVKKKPTGWDDLIDPQYKDNIGTWIRAAALAELSSKWGEDRVMDFYKKMLALNPMFFESAAPLATSVAAGEIAIGLGSFHNSMPPKKKGAPIDMVALDPTPVSSIVSFVTSKAAAPNTAALFISWLASPEGNLAYENVTGRGSPLIPSTQTAKFVGTLPVTEWPLDNKEPYAKIFDKMNRMVENAKVVK